MARILIIEDESLISSFFVSLLKASGYQAIAAASGKQAFCLLHKTPVDLVVVDLLLPGMDGFQIIEKLKANFPDTRIIAMTGNPTILPKAKELGVDGTIAKPISIADFWAAVEGVLPKKQEK